MVFPHSKDLASVFHGCRKIAFHTSPRSLWACLPVKKKAPMEKFHSLSAQMAKAKCYDKVFLPNFPPNRITRLQLSCKPEKLPESQLGIWGYNCLLIRKICQMQIISLAPDFYSSFYLKSSSFLFACPPIPCKAGVAFPTCIFLPEFH